MSFFKPPTTVPQPPSTTHQGVPRTTQRGDRQIAQRTADAPPEHRTPAPTKANRGHMGLTNDRVLERLPRGCLFKVGGGYFDLDGYWCVRKADHHVEVRRGAGRAIHRLMSKRQRDELARVRLNARRNGVR